MAEFRPKPAGPAGEIRFLSSAGQPARRAAGTAAAGIGLVAIGLASLIEIFNPSFDISLLRRLFPLLFVLLGAELLACYSRRKSKKGPLFVGIGLVLSGGYLLLAPAVKAACLRLGYSPWLLDQISRRISSVTAAILIILIGIQLLGGKRAAPHRIERIEQK